jgi:hypothetical protein
MTPTRTKITQAAAGYTDKAGPGQRCGTCVMFLPALRRCTLVQGSILAEGWCRRWERIPSNKERV